MWRIVNEIESLPPIHHFRENRSDFRSPAGYSGARKEFLQSTHILGVKNKYGKKSPPSFYCIIWCSMKRYFEWAIYCVGEFLRNLRIFTSKTGNKKMFSRGQSRFFAVKMCNLRRSYAHAIYSSFERAILSKCIR